MEKVLNMTYASSLTDLCEINSSFDTGVLRIAYTGENRNKTSISKEVFERCIKTMYNCPIVCHYERETDSLGGHDIALVKDDGGTLRIVNLTTPVGVIPESAKYWWDTVKEEDGTEHEYLFTEVLLWKRQEAYKKIKEEGIVAHSMEITVKDGEEVDGIYRIYDFEFTAFALIGVEPCFESSALELYSNADFATELSKMMQEIKDSQILVTASNEDDNIHPQKYSTEGGNTALKDMENNVEEKVVDEVVEDEVTVSDEPVGTDEPEMTASPDEPDNFALIHNIVEEICRALYEEKIETECGEWPRYCYVDSDLEVNEVYCWDSTDWLLYGFSFSLNGDNVVIDYDSKKRMKYAIVDFDEGEQPSPFAGIYNAMEKKLEESKDWSVKYQEATETVASMEAELGELREYKANVELAKAQADREELFIRFEDLAGFDAYDNLIASAMDYDIETLEEKLYALRGKLAHTGKFALEEKAPKIVVEDKDTQTEPYGGLFAKYGIG